MITNTVEVHWTLIILKVLQMKYLVNSPFIILLKEKAGEEGHLISILL